MSISEYFGIELDYIVIGLAALVFLLMILTIINIVQMKKLKKRYIVFMDGKNAKSLEEILSKRLDQIDSLIESNSRNQRNIEKIFKTMQFTYQKMGIIKYDAFHEMGGKLSFSIAMLNEKNDGFIINAMHSREGCYTYIKEIIDGNSIIALADEEKEALEMAKGSADV